MWWWERGASEGASGSVYEATVKALNEERTIVMQSSYPSSIMKESCGASLLRLVKYTLERKDLWKQSQSSIEKPWLWMCGLAFPSSTVSLKNLESQTGAGVYLCWNVKSAIITSSTWVGAGIMVPSQFSLWKRVSCFIFPVTLLPFLPPLCK